MIWRFVSPSTLSLISPSGFLLQVSRAGVHTDVNACVDVCVCRGGGRRGEEGEGRRELVKQEGG